MADGGYELDQLADGRTLIAFDQRSGGRSDLVNDPDLLTVEHYLGDLEALRQHFGLEEMILIGQSWGAGLATLYTGRHPDRVVRLLLLSPMPPARDPYMGERITATNAVIGETEVARMNAIPAEMQNAPDRLVQPLCEERIRLMFRGYLTDLSALDRMKVGYCEGTPASLRHQEMATAAAGVSLGAWDFRPLLEEIPVPILVVEGEDTHVPLDATRVWVQSSPNSRLLLIPDANHMTWLEGDLPAFFRAMNQYLAGDWPEGAEELGTGTG
jgi:pimeloyl-ACP methyl ester carboxylesterase